LSIVFKENLKYFDLFKKILNEFYNKFIKFQRIWPIFNKYLKIIFGKEILFTFNIRIRNLKGMNIQDIIRYNKYYSLLI